MDWKLFFVSFSTIFVAELGDKTQLFTISLSSQSKSTLEVLLAVVLALSLAGVLGVVAGKLIAQWIDPRVLRLISGGVFIAAGIWFLVNTKGG